MISRLSFLVVAAACGFVLAGSNVAAAASVAYVDSNEVWVATTDGATRARLSNGEGDWRAVAQSDQGYVVGIQLEAGKIAALSHFTVWDPNGNRVKAGPLAGTPGGWSEAYPLSLDLTPDAGLLVYGFSRCTGALPCGTLIRGHYLLPSATVMAPVSGPLANNSIRWPTLVGERVVGTPDETTNAVQEPGSIAGTTFNNWFNYSAGGYEMNRTDVSATGTVTATELVLGGSTRRIALGKYQSLGGTYVDDCFLDADPAATQPSVSQDASEFAWQDGGGVKVAGVPNFNGAATCQLTRGPDNYLGNRQVPLYRSVQRDQVRRAADRRWQAADHGPQLVRHRQTARQRRAGIADVKQRGQGNDQADRDAEVGRQKGQETDCDRQRNRHGRRERRQARQAEAE